MLASVSNNGEGNIVFAPRFFCCWTDWIFRTGLDFCMSPQKLDWVGRRLEIILLKRYELDASLFHAAEGDGISASTGWYPLELFGSTCSLFSPQRHAARDPLREISLPRFGPHRSV